MFKNISKRLPVKNEKRLYEKILCFLKICTFEKWNELFCIKCFQAMMKIFGILLVEFVTISEACLVNVYEGNNEEIPTLMLPLSCKREPICRRGRKWVGFTDAKKDDKADPWIRDHIPRNIRRRKRIRKRLVFLFFSFFLSEHAQLLILWSWSYTKEGGGRGYPRGDGGERLTETE